MNNKGNTYFYYPLLDISKFILSLIIVIYHYNYYMLNWQNQKMFGGVS